MIILMMVFIFFRGTPPAADLGGDISVMTVTVAMAMATATVAVMARSIVMVMIMMDCDVDCEVDGIGDTNDGDDGGYASDGCMHSCRMHIR